MSYFFMVKPHKTIRAALCSILIGLQLILPTTTNAGDYHALGWINTIIPGSGEVLLKEPVLGATQAVIEVGTFAWGYILSPRSDLTIDGTPQDYPAIRSKAISKTTYKRVLVNGVYRIVPISSLSFAQNTQLSDITTANNAALLQEVGLKYHMVNVFNAYREGYKRYKGDKGQGIDERSTLQLFADPFDLKTLASPWVWGPIAVVLGTTIMDYNSQISPGGGLTPIQRLTPFSNTYVGFNQLAIYPVGSGAPEEMFYRGFVQNEAYHWVHSPFFSIPVSAAAFSFSHSPDGRVGAAISGTYLGFLAHKNNGKLAEGIAVHFWSVVILGVESLLLTVRSQYFDKNASGPFGAKVDFLF